MYNEKLLVVIFFKNIFLKGWCEYGMVRLEMRGNESLDKVLKRFKKICEKEGIRKETTRCSYYEKPSEKRRRRLLDKKRELRKQARLNSYNK